MDRLGGGLALRRGRLDGGDIGRGIASIKILNFPRGGSGARETGPAIPPARSDVHPTDSAQ